MINYDVTPVIWKMERVGNLSYFWDMSHNALFSYDGVNVRNIDLKCTKNRKIFNENSLYNGVYCKDGKLYFSPHTANYGLVLSLKNTTENYVEYPKELREYINKNHINGYFTKIVFDRDYAFYIGALVPCVLVFDLKTETFIKTFFFELDNFSFFKDAVVVDGKLFIVEGDHNRVIVWNKDNSYEVRKFNELKKGFSSICVFSKLLFLIPRYDEPIVIWNIKTDSIEILSEYPEEFTFAKDGNREIAFSLCVDSKIYLFPAYASDVLYYDVESKSLFIDRIISESIRSEKDKDDMQEIAKCIFIEKYGNVMVIQNGYSLSLLNYNYEKKEVKIEKLKFDNFENAKFKRFKMEHIIKDNKIINESEEFMLKDLIHIIL